MPTHVQCSSRILKQSYITGDVAIQSNPLWWHHLWCGSRTTLSLSGAESLCSWKVCPPNACCGSKGWSTNLPACVLIALREWWETKLRVSEQASQYKPGVSTATGRHSPATMQWSPVFTCQAVAMLQLWDWSSRDYKSDVSNSISRAALSAGGNPVPQGGEGQHSPLKQSHASQRRTRGGWSWTWSMCFAGRWVPCRRGFPIRLQKFPLMLLWFSIFSLHCTQGLSAHLRVSKQPGVTYCEQQPLQLHSS